MKGSDLLRIIDEMQHLKNIDREIIFSGIESALQMAAEKNGSRSLRSSGSRSQSSHVTSTEDFWA